MVSFGRGGALQKPRCAEDQLVTTLRKASRRPVAPIRPEFIGMFSVKLRLTAVSDPQHDGFTAGFSPVSWGSIDELSST